MLDRLKWLKHFFLEIGKEEPEVGRYFIYMYPPLTYWGPQVDSVVFSEHRSATKKVSTEPFLIYTHIPFCQKHCEFCYYAVTTNSTAERMSQYVSDLIGEMKLYSDLGFEKRKASVVYIGGGTPSHLSENQIVEVLKGHHSHFDLSEIEEFTFECAPRSVTEEKIRLLKDHGVTRGSLGIQQYDDSVLAQNGRVHVTKEVDRALEIVAKFGFQQLNVDLISGLVGQSRESFERSVLGLARRWGSVLTGVTIYPMQVLSHSPMAFRKGLEGKSSVGETANWPEKRYRLEQGFNILADFGFQRCTPYSAVKSREEHYSRYQRQQYHGRDQIGLGTSALGHVQGLHYQNVTNSVERYGEAIRLGRFPVVRSYNLSLEEQMIRELVLQLRLGKVSQNYFQEKYQVDLLRIFAEEIRGLQEGGWLYQQGDWLCLTPDGISRVDRLIAVFFHQNHRDALLAAW